MSVVPQSFLNKQYVGPYSPQVYNTANTIKAGGTGAPYNPNILSAARTVIQKQSQVPTVNGTSTYQPSGPAGGGGGGGTNPGANQNIQDNLNAGNDQIDRDYQDYLSQLSGQEGNLQSQANTATSKVEGAYGPVNTQLQQQQSEKLGGLDVQQQQVQGQERSQLQQARDMYRQLQQENGARLSGLGISSSSVAEALAENLGVETARRIASVSQNAGDVYQNIQKERSNVKDYVQNRLTDLQQQIAQQKSDIQTQLMQGLNQINQARNTAAVDKADRRQQLISQAQNASYQLQQNAQNFAQAMQQWQSQTQSKLASTAGQDFSGLFQNQLQGMQGINNLIGNVPQGYGATFNMQPTGLFTTQISPNNKKNPLDPLAPPDQWGIPQ